MKLKHKNSIFNMGDTSIRVHEIVEINFILLNLIDKFMKRNKIWDKKEQENFYQLFINEIINLERNYGQKLFKKFSRTSDKEVDESKQGLRARTLTNNLMKIGFINKDRKISDVGYSYLYGSLKNPDRIESLLNLSTHNLVYLRQLFKTKIYDSESDEYFYNFRFAIKFLSKYTGISQNHFLTIIESIRPTQSNKELNHIIDDYQQVYYNKLSFDDFYKNNFTHLFISHVDIDKAESLLQNDKFDFDEFSSLFTNKKTTKSVKEYLNFVNTLINFNNNPSKENMDLLILSSKKDVIKKAFGSNSTLFKYNSKDTVDSFISKNKNDTLLLKPINKIYIEFIMNKTADIIREYSDMCKRLFEISGLISFNNGIVKLNQSWIITPLLSFLSDKFTLRGRDSYLDYENKDNSVWFSDLSLCEIFGINGNDKDAIMNLIKKQIGFGDGSYDFKFNLELKNEEEFRDYIYKKFPKKKVIEILQNIDTRNDEFVFNLVTRNATIPTIYEYILTIAWFYISESKNYNLHKCFGVTLDGNHLPIIHNSGYKGDIEIFTDKYSLQIEATLVNKYNQKRAELEPVIRHAINFESKNYAPQTIYIANELDDNVINIFRASQFIEFKDTTSNMRHVYGVNIFAFTTNEIIRILDSDITDTEILNVINKHKNNTPIFIKQGWREHVLSDLFS